MARLSDHVDELAAAVVALAGIALGVLVGEDGPDRLQDRLGDEVLRGDHLELRALPLRLVADRAAIPGSVRARFSMSECLVSGCVDLAHAHGVAAAHEGGI